MTTIATWANGIMVVLGCAAYYTGEELVKLTHQHDCTIYVYRVCVDGNIVPETLCYYPDLVVTQS